MGETLDARRPTGDPMVSERADGCKLDRVADRRGIAGIDDRLLDHWQNGASLRDIETIYNRAVLRAAMTAADMNPIDGEVANLYRLLTADDVSAGERIDAEARLARNDIDPDELTADFVSYGTVRTHLNECLGVETERDADLTVGDARTTVMKLLSRVETVTARTLDRLDTHGLVSVARPSVTVSLRVGCEACNDEYSFTRLLDQGGCSCGD